MDTRILVEV